MLEVKNCIFNNIDQNKDRKVQSSNFLVYFVEWSQLKGEKVRRVGNVSYLNSSFYKVKGVS